MSASPPNPDIAWLGPLRLIQSEQTKGSAHIAQSGICYLTRLRGAAFDDLQHIAWVTSECEATVSDWPENCLQHAFQTFLHNAVAQTAADIARLQILNR